MSQAQPGVPQTTKPPAELSLAADFPTPSRAEWVALVDQVTRAARRIPDDAEPGAGEAALTRPDLDGIPVRPLYTADDGPTEAIGVPGSPPYLRGARATGAVPTGWQVRQRHREPDPAAAAAGIAADLDNGVGAIWLAVGEGATAPADLGAVLADVLLDVAPVVLDAGAVAEEAAEAFLAVAAERGVPDADLLGTLGLDPIGLRAAIGTGPATASVVPLALRVAERYPQLRAIVVDALPVHAAGGSDAQELGYSLAAGVAYLRELVAVGVGVDAAARLLEFRYAATAEQFPTIAKLRAARRLWCRVTEACGAAAPQFQHAVGSPTMLTRRDPYVNLLRGTVAGFAAGVGGADAVTVPPFDAAIGASEPFSRRIARNTQALLVDEAHLARVIDPAGGSWYVEAHTAALARAAWAFFQELEAAGGRGGRAGLGAARRTHRGGARPAGAGRGHPAHRGDRGERVPRPRRAPGLPDAAAGAGRCRAAALPAGRAVRGVAGPLGRAARRNRPAAACVPGHARPAGRLHDPRRLRPQPVAGRRRRGRRSRPDRDRGRGRGGLRGGRHPGGRALFDRPDLRRARRGVARPPCARPAPNCCCSPVERRSPAWTGTWPPAPTRWP